MRNTDQLIVAAEKYLKDIAQTGGSGMNVAMLVLELKDQLQNFKTLLEPIKLEIEYARDNGQYLADDHMLFNFMGGEEFPQKSSSVGQFRKVMGNDAPLLLASK